MRIEAVQWKVENERQLWVFIYDGYQGFRLVQYHEQTRESKRHKWRGPFWDHNDERGYHSKLPRPTEIPEMVLEQARDEIKALIDGAPVYIGWYNKDSKYK